MTIEEILKGIIKVEGGFQKDPADRGNWTTGVVGKGELKGTKYGISAMSFPEEDIENLTPERAYELLYQHYVVEPGFLYIRPDYLQAQLVDFAINSGPDRAIKFLQRLLELPADGRIEAVYSELWKHSPLLVNDALAGARARFIDDLTDAKASMKKFEEGLESRALSFVRSTKG